ncbi:MAG: hypothetical protein MHPSP_004650, partial [Paramarteilia canceri]
FFPITKWSLWLRRAGDKLTVSKMRIFGSNLSPSLKLLYFAEYSNLRELVLCLYDCIKGANFNRALKRVLLYSKSSPKSINSHLKCIHGFDCKLEESLNESRKKNSITAFTFEQNIIEIWDFNSWISKLVCADNVIMNKLVSSKTLHFEKYCLHLIHYTEIITSNYAKVIVEAEIKRRISIKQRPSLMFDELTGRDKNHYISLIADFSDLRFYLGLKKVE